MPTSARTATRSTPASRRFWTPVAGLPGSRSGTRRRSSWLTAPVTPEGVAGAVALTGDLAVFEAVEALKHEYAELERRMSDPALHGDQAEARRVGKRYAALAPIVRTYDEWRQTGDDLEAARELADEDPAFAEEAARLETRH